MRLTLGVRAYDLSRRALVMGVLQVPCGRSSSGVTSADLDACRDGAQRLVGEGADVVEVVAPSRSADGSGVSESEELALVVPVVEDLHQRLDVPLSCATTRWAVAGAACQAGAVLADDASGLSDTAYLPGAVAAGATLVIGHPGAGRRPPPGNGGTPDLVSEVESFLAERARRAERAGLGRERIVLDAGCAGAATAERLVQLVRASPALAELGYPLLVATPEVPVVGRVHDQLDDRRTTAAGVLAAGFMAGCRVLRTGDVRTARRVADVLAAILAA